MFTDSSVTQVRAEAADAGAAANEDRPRAGLLEEKEGGSWALGTGQLKEGEEQHLVETSRLALFLVRTTASRFSRRVRLLTRDAVLCCRQMVAFIGLRSTVRGV